MGVDIHIHVCYRRGNKWEEVKLYKETEKGIKSIPCWEGRNSILFDLMNDLSSYFPKGLIDKATLPSELKQEIEDWENDGYGFYQANLADIKLYIAEHPKIEDEEDENNILIESPVLYLVQSIEAYIGFYEPDWLFLGNYSDIKIVYWFDR